MIVDLRTRVWDSIDELGTSVAEASRRRRTEPWVSTTATAEAHAEAMGPVAVAAILGFESGLLGAAIPPERVAAAVANDPQKYLGFVGIDPTLGRAVPRLEAALDMGLVGVTVSPAAAGFHPADTRAMDLFEACAHRGVPVVVESAAILSPQVNLEFAQPYLFDEVARTFPDLKLVIGSFGLPFLDQGAALLAKHPSVYADVSGLVTRSWQLYNALVNAYQSDVMGQVLFGSGYPFCDPERAIVTLYSVNSISQGTPLPSVPREQLRTVVERDTLKALGLPHPSEVEIKLPTEPADDAAEEIDAAAAPEAVTVPDQPDEAPDADTKPKRKRKAKP